MKERAIYHSKLLRAFIAILIVVMVVLTLLPYGIEYGIVRALHDQGAEDASVENVDFNPFTGRLIVQDLSIREGSSTPFIISDLEMQISWLSLFGKKIYLQKLALNKLNISIEQLNDSGWKIGGISIPGEKSEPQEAAPEKPAPSQWGFGIEDLAIRSSHIKFRGMDLESELDISALDILNIKSWEPELEASVAFSGGLNGSGLKIKTAVFPFSAFPSVTGTYSVDTLYLLPFNALLMKEGKMNIESGSLSSEGRFEYSAGPEKDQINFSGGVTIDDFSLDNLEGIQLLALKKLDLREIEVESLEKISISEAEMENMEVIKPVDKASTDAGKPESLLKIDRLLVSEITTSSLNDISIRSIELKGAKSFLLRRPDGKWYLIDDITGIQENGGDKEKPVDDKGEPFRIRIANIVIGDNSSIRFEDESIKPPYRTELMLDKVEVRDIDSSGPETKSSLSVEGKIGDYSMLRFSGDIQPFAERLTMHINGKATQLDLPPLSSYTAGILGYSMDSGHLTADIDMKITSGNIAGDNMLVLEKMKISPKNENRIKKFVSELTISIETAVSLLRDSDGTIRIKLPVTGDISDPDIGLQNIINKALLAGMKKGVFGYLKNAFQPYGALITVIEIAGKAARLRLDPVEFEAGSNMLDAKAGDYLKKVADIMKERPKIKISICGKVTPDDIAVLSEKALETQQKKSASSQPAEILDDQLLKFAEERAMAVKKRLIEDQGIESGRLFICNPEIERDEKNKPRAALLI